MLKLYDLSGKNDLRFSPPCWNVKLCLIQNNIKLAAKKGRIFGSDQVAYGSTRNDGRSWRQWAYETYDFDPNRLHFSPPLQYKEYVEVLQHSWVHVYWTIPFILSWGLMEALSTGCAVVASNTDPVKEVIRPGEHGILVDFYDTDGLAGRVDELLRDSKRRHDLGTSARHMILTNGYDLNQCLHQKRRSIDELLHG